jgi:hypothetical protein
MLPHEYFHKIKSTDVEIDEVHLVVDGHPYKKRMH